MLARGEGNLVEPHDGPLRPGDIFERYEIRGEIARGGSAFVYGAYQEFLDRHVAIKVIPCKREQAREFRRRARAEAVVLSRLRHPNVVPVYDAGVTDDGSLIYIVMEQLEGCTLREVLEAVGPLSVPEALVVGAQACDAVEGAHRHGAIHRDLKPENLFIEDGNHLRVLDFGVAKFLGAGAATTAKHRWHGTPLYMSPEHLQGCGVTPRSDIYALGTLLWESFAGRNPCLNGIDTPTFQEIGWIQIASVPPLLTEVVPAIPDYVARVIQRAIAKAPEHRYGSMHDFGVALRDAERRFTLECRERRLAPVARDLVQCTRAVCPAPASATHTFDTEKSAVPAWATAEAGVAVGAARGTRDTVKMAVPIAGALPPDAPQADRDAQSVPARAGNTAGPGLSFHVATVHAPGDSTHAHAGSRLPAASVEHTPSPVATPVDEHARPHVDGTKAEAARRPHPPPGPRRRSRSSTRLGVLGAGVGLLIAIPIGVTVGLARRHAAGTRSTLAGSPALSAPAGSTRQPTPVAAAPHTASGASARSGSASALAGPADSSPPTQPGALAAASAAPPPTPTSARKRPVAEPNGPAPAPRRAAPHTSRTPAQRKTAMPSSGLDSAPAAKPTATAPRPDTHADTPLF